jgi:hypothetical protein
VHIVIVRSDGTELNAVVRSGSSSQQQYETIVLGYCVGWYYRPLEIDNSIAAHSIDLNAHHIDQLEFNSDYIQPTATSIFERSLAVWLSYAFRRQTT